MNYTKTSNHLVLFFLQPKMAARKIKGHGCKKTPGKNNSKITSFIYKSASRLP